MYALCRVEQVADGGIVVERVNQVSDILAHVDRLIPLSCLQLVLGINEVGREDFREDALLIGFVELLKPVTEQTEGGEDA